MGWIKTGSQHSNSLNRARMLMEYPIISLKAHSCSLPRLRCLAGSVRGFHGGFSGGIEVTGVGDPITSVVC